jgi:hypothetical protein
MDARAPVGLGQCAKRSPAEAGAAGAEHQNVGAMFLEGGDHGPQRLQIVAPAGQRQKRQGAVAMPCAQLRQPETRLTQRPSQLRFAQTAFAEAVID